MQIPRLAILGSYLLTAPQNTNVLVQAEPTSRRQVALENQLDYYLRAQINF